MVDEERGVNGNGVLTEDANRESVIRCEVAQVANGDANSRLCETQMDDCSGNSRDCETQVDNGGANSRECETQMTIGGADSRECEAQVENGDANLREFEIQVTNGGANSSELETQMINDGANLRECEAQMAKNGANSREGETQMTNSGANSRELETQMTDAGANSRELETPLTNSGANYRELETQMTNAGTDHRALETQMTDAGANYRELETPMTNAGANLRECETQMTNGGANPRELETQMTNTGANLRDGLQMYKRRKYLKGSTESSKVLEDGKTCMDSASQVSDKTTKEPVDKVFDNSSCDQVLPRLDSNSFGNGLGDCLQRHGREFVLEEMYQSCESEGGLRECIQNALMSHPENGCPSTVKDHHCFGEGRHRFPFQHVGVLSNGSLNDSNHHSKTELCKHVFFNILGSEKFTELCNLLFRSFHGVKLDRVLDVSVINSRMKEGAYESSPMLFRSDIQQVWTRLQDVGNEMVALGKSLSDSTMTFCDKLMVNKIISTLSQTQEVFVGASVCTTYKDGMDKHFAQESDMLAAPEPMETCGTYRVCSCRHCGEKADGENCLVCDSCEEMYHVSCIKPPVEQVPLACWYCSSCVANGAEKPHEDCALCERLAASRSPVDGILVSDDELEEGGPSKGGRKWARCNICRNEVKTTEKYRTCGHLHCASKYYHDSCLTSKQLGIYASCWYCPSCLCRSCLTDKDDDKIVMCDGCDQAYHIYCMQPPCESIPEGKWFCTKCDAALQRIQRAKKAYESRQDELKSKDLKGKGENGNLKLDKSGGVDMLLTAAKTLNYQESMEELRKKR